ncbi:M56 family metallopeptidase [Streptosporangium sp. NBC_01639]|uniref:M56 family metallopeptidase n=1 Tax=unclassified Streptosporangium TaxID=2632669 RepID=UPI002DDC62A3|nr:M56 family metallopeptidase [Streptosporangium sp. NBC_01756]WSC83349.1 M56 family metallopeptidase [Streptosporangium sp. NBC_01756]WTD58077.1 M56 family metallopeptidase [Streptosporangium sp. NBC_01639]
MITAAALATLALVCAVGAWRFTRARWTYRAPHVAIVLWQALGVTWGLAGTGALLAYALEPYGQGVLHGLAAFASSALGAGDGPLEPYDLPRILALVAGLTALTVLVMVLLSAGVQTLRARHRHRVLLTLIAREDPGVPGVRVVDHPGATAYCVPGLRSQVVVSAGTLKLLSADELTAVLAHETAHVRERHDLVLLPFAALRRALPWSRFIATVQNEVSLLVEMAADDVARRYCSPRRLATALLRFGTAGAVPTPNGALGAAGSSSAVMARVERLITPGPYLPLGVRYSIVAFSVTLTASAPLLWLIPH